MSIIDVYGAKELVDKFRDFIAKKDYKSALELAEEILGDFPAIYEHFSGKDFMEPINNAINTIKDDAYRHYKTMRDMHNGDKEATRRQYMRSGAFKEEYEYRYELEQKIKEINEKLNPSLKNDEIKGINFDASLQNNQKPTHKITTTLNLNSLLKSQTKLQDKTQISSVNIPQTKSQINSVDIPQTKQSQTQKPTISKKPSIAILANLDKLTPKELLDELHRLKNLPIKNDFTYEAMSKIQNQLEKFNQTDNINLENGMKV